MRNYKFILLCLLSMSSLKAMFQVTKDETAEYIAYETDVHNGFTHIKNEECESKGGGCGYTVIAIKDKKNNICSLNFYFQKNDGNKKLGHARLANQEKEYERLRKQYEKQSNLPDDLTDGSDV